jgi:hypothetical protein
MDLLTDMSSYRDQSDCPTCGAAETLVDGLWWACPSCHPATAERGTAEWMR